MPQDNLSFEAELERQKALYGVSRIDVLPNSIMRNAAQIHAYLISDALFKTLDSPYRVAAALKSERARYFAQFGVSRRLDMMFFAWQRIISIVPVNRTKPLEIEESRELNNDLNTLYINIRGTLDNLAWVLVHHTASARALKAKESQVGLFQACIIDDERFAPIADQLRAHSDWNRELKTRRDPSAHRIPLAVVRTTVNAEQAATLSDLNSRTWEAIGRGAHQAAGDMIRRQQEVGRFQPLFWHDPGEAPMPIYPTVSEDLRHLIELTSICAEFLVGSS